MDKATCTWQTLATCELKDLADSLGLVVNSLTLLVAVLALAVAVYTFFLTKRHLGIERVHRLTERMYELDRVLLNAPELQRLLYERANDTTPYFVEKDGVSPGDIYFKIKSYIYMCLTCFDEVISIAHGDAHLKEVMEYQDWERYILKEMRHPLFRELRDKKRDIWGTRFNAFIDKKCSDPHQVYTAAERQVL